MFLALQKGAVGISTAASNCTELSKMLIHAATYTHLVNDAKKSSPLSGSAAAADSSGADESRTKEPPFGRSDSWRKPKDKTDMQLLEQARNGIALFRGVAGGCMLRTGEGGGQADGCMLQ